MFAQAPTLLQQKQQCLAMLKAQRATEAISCLQDLCRVYPRDHELWFLLGSAHGLRNEIDQAERCLRHALELAPGLPEGYYNLGKTLELQQRFSEAAECYGRALQLIVSKGGPIPRRYAEAYRNMGNAFMKMGRGEEAIDRYRKALEIDPRDFGTHSNLLFALNYQPGHTRAQIFEEHRRWDAMHARALLPASPTRTDPDPGRRLRIGYVSADFRTHPVVKFMEPVWDAHDRAQFELFGYANVSNPDETTGRMRGYFAHWRDILPLSDAEAAALIRSDAIDILVDLTGHTANHRLLVFARKPAPLQVTGLGYPNTTSMSAMDYRLGTRYTDPPGETERYYSERLLRLDSHYSYRPWEGSPPVNDLPALTRGHVTFASLNNFAKVTPAVIDLWARVLALVPGSRLLMKAEGLGDAATRAYARESFARHGIAPERLDLRAWGPLREYMETFHEADIALDPFPFCGGTTTYNTLWMGVPVVTLAGENYMARVGLSILASLGLEDLVAHTEAEYIARAVELAGNPGRLQALRAGMRERMLASPLTDGPRFTRGLEGILRESWREWCARQSGG